MQAIIKQTCIYFGKFKLIIFESVAHGLYNHHGFQLTMEGRQWVSGENIRIGVMRPKKSWEQIVTFEAYLYPIRS